MSICACAEYSGRGYRGFSCGTPTVVGREMGKDTVVIRSEVDKSVKRPIMRHPDQVRWVCLSYSAASEHLFASCVM